MYIGIGVEGIYTKSMGNSYTSQNDHDETPMKKAKFSKCESCMKISERFENN